MLLANPDFFSSGNGPLVVLCFFMLLAIVPFALLGLTSFIKITVVLGVLRIALGAGKIPSTAVTSLLALVLSGYIMAPVVNEVRDSLPDKFQVAIADYDIPTILSLTSDTLEPLREFLTRHSGTKERLFFQELYRSKGQVDSSLGSFLWLIPAFVLTELREAFVIGFAIYLPFLAIDLFIANLLVGLGIVMVSPTTISLPLKLFLFVASDAWLLLTESLILGYWPEGLS